MTRHVGKLCIALLSVLPLWGQSDADVTIRSVQEGVFTTAQSERGAKVYEVACVRCHLPNQFVGPAYMDSWTGQTAETLFELIRRTMPEGSPGRLKRTEYAEILAYVFSLNRMPVGKAELKGDTQSLKQIRIEGPYGRAAGSKDSKPNSKH